MPTNNKLVAILSIAAISFILLIIVLFAEVKDTSSNSDQSNSNSNDQKKISSPSSSSRRRLKPVPPLVSEEQNNNNKKESPIDEFFKSHLEEHPLENCPSGKFYSATDIARHNTEDDLWIVLYGHVLNVTSFVHHHPGGVSMIMKGAAATTGVVSDVADLFVQYHQPGTISLFNTFCIGKVREGEVKKNW